MNTPSSYQELVANLFKLNRTSGCLPGLDRMQALLPLLGSPQLTFATIQVAGTNGKGSVTKKIARALQNGGYRVGCYTSPHISCFRERIQVDDAWITEAEVLTEMKTLLGIAERAQIPATFFELTTALAFMHFARAKVDVAVLETGLGGRFDATNCVQPLLSVITSISLDHTDILGETLDAIAWEKGGIIKPGIPVIVGPHANLPVIQQIALEQQSPLHCVNISTQDFDSENSAIAEKALRELQKEFLLTSEQIANGLKVRPVCRFEKVSEQVLANVSLTHHPETIILDVAHNPDAMVKLVQALDQHYPGKQVDFICGFSKCKDVVGCLKLLKPKGHHLHLISGQHERSMDIITLQQHAAAVGFPEHQVSVWHNAKQAVEAGCRQATDQGALLVICGSFFIMAEVRAALGYKEPQDTLNLNEHLKIR